MKLPAALSALRHRDFRLYWCGQAVSLVGTWMQIMAQGWVVTELSKDAIVLGLLNAASAVPMLLLSLKSGELADRFEKRRILVVTQVAMMVLSFIFAGLVFSGHLQLWHVFVMGALLGTAAAFDLPASQSMPPELVEQAEIPNAVGLMQSMFHGARLVGPALAGILMARLGRGSAFVANGVSYLAVIATLLVITPRPPRPRPSRPAGGKSMIAEGFAYLRGDQATRALIALTALITGLVFPFLTVLMVYYVRYALGTDDPQVMGLMMSASGFGSLVGAGAILGGSPETRRTWLVGGVCGVTVGLGGLSVARSLPMVLPLAVVLAFSVSSLMGRISQMVQERVPGELRGRVMGIYSISFTGIMPFASMLWAFLIDRLGHGAGYVLVMRVSASVFFVAALALLQRAWAHLAPAARATA